MGCGCGEGKMGVKVRGEREEKKSEENRERGTMGRNVEKGIRKDR